MSKTDRKKFFNSIQKVVVKIGSSVLTDTGGYILDKPFNHIASQVSKLIESNIKCIIVSSGAIAAGMKKLELENRPHEIHRKQAIAASGQSDLIWRYEKSFSKYKLKVAQVLLTHDGLADRKRFLNARSTINELLKMNIVPIVNENDTVSVEEIMFGDNDNLAALVTSLTAADLLILLTDIDGLYDKDPRKDANAVFIPQINEIDEIIEKIAGDTSGRTTIGGMRTKIQATKTVSAFGVPTIIANGKNKKILGQLFNGEEIGTLVIPSQERLKSRKHWIAFNLKSNGEIIIDEGAKNAITKRGKSILPSGIKKVRGNFGIGEAIRCMSEDGKEIARGLTSYTSEELKRIMGVKTSEIEGILGYKYSDEVIHRDDLAIVENNSK